MNVGAIGLLMAALSLLLAPVTYHRLAAGGDATEDVHAFTTSMVALAPLPFAAVIGMDVVIVSDTDVGIVIAGVLTLVALILWYGIEFMNRKPPTAKSQGSIKPTMAERIRTINTEARIVLPGVQALLGFQFAAFLMQGFDKLPETAKRVHLAGLVALALAVIFLMAPPAYHRIAAHGEARADVDTFAAVMVLGSLLPLTIGLAADFYLAFGIVGGWAAWTIFVSLTAAALMLGLWFGYPAWIKWRARPST
jgi:hypothetical protein